MRPSVIQGRPFTGEGPRIAEGDFVFLPLLRGQQPESSPCIRYPMKVFLKATQKTKMLIYIFVYIINCIYIYICTCIDTISLLAYMDSSIASYIPESRTLDSELGMWNYSCAAGAHEQCSI